MLRQTTGSVLCVSCGQLVGVNDERCLNCGRWNPGLWGYAGTIRKLGNDLGFVKLVLMACAGLYIISYLIDQQPMDGGILNLFSPGPKGLLLFGASGALPVIFLGHWWTLLSAGWLHGSLLHIAFNMMWVRSLAPTTAETYGAGRMVIIYTVSSITGFFLSSVAAYVRYGIYSQGHYTVGASAAIFGLLGALVYYGRRGSGAVGRQAWGYAVFFFIIGLIVPMVNNWAHGGGFVGGYLAGMVLNPMKPERGDHLLIAVVCLLLTALAIVVSILTGLPMFFGRGA